MATEVLMPRLSDSMEEGTILTWLKAAGDTVAAGEPLAEIETDKASMTCEALTAGVLLEILVPEGETAALGAPLALIGEPGETAAGVGTPARQPEPGPASPSGNGGVPALDQPHSGAPEPPAGSPALRVKASPLARRVARELGVDLAGLEGSGPGGRVVRRDVEASAPAPAPAPATEGAAVDGAKGPTRIEAISRQQQLIARRMAESKATVPEFTLFADVEMSACVELRSKLKELTPTPPSYNDIVVKAAALALREHPRANGSYRDGSFELHERVNVGVAVSAPDGLVVPTIFDADRRSLGEIAGEVRRLAAAVRDGSITAPELAGGTFTVSNLGMFGVRSFAAIVNPPQAAILSVGAMEQRAVVDPEGNVVARPVLTLGLICDHRILYGADAAEFLRRVGELLGEPLAMAL